MKAIEKLLILTTVVLLMVFSGLAGILIVYGKQFKVEVLEIELKPKASASETQVSLAHHHNKQYNIRRAQYHNKPHKSHINQTT